MRQLAIGDIHGCLKLFEGLLEQMQFSKNDELFLLGDYVDRGEDSKGVIDKILELRHKGFKINCLMGNHEQLLLNNYYNYDTETHYPDAACLRSFGVRHTWNIPEKYITFFQSLPLYMVTEKYILVHAGLNFDAQDPLADAYSLIWIRYWYENIDKDWLNGRIILHGHTPQTKQDTEIMLKHLKRRPVLNLDCCAFYSNRSPTKHALCGFDMTNQKLYFQSERPKSFWGLK
jgi:serine/threonine protein phosphatase 1